MAAHTVQASLHDCCWQQRKAQKHLNENTENETNVNNTTTGLKPANLSGPSSMPEELQIALHYSSLNSQFRLVESSLGLISLV